jgi:hypothetical protein
MPTSDSTAMVYWLAKTAGDTQISEAIATLDCTTSYFLPTAGLESSVNNRPCRLPPPWPQGKFLIGFQVLSCIKPLRIKRMHEL